MQELHCMENKYFFFEVFLTYWGSSSLHLNVTFTFENDMNSTCVMYLQIWKFLHLVYSFQNIIL